MSGRLFQSDAERESWQELPIPVDLSYGQVAVDAKNDCHIYFSGTTGFIKSTDCGASWDDISVDLPDEWVTVVVTSPTEAGVAFVWVYSHGVYRTGDGGATWTEISPPGLSANYGRLVVHPADSHRLFLTTTTSVYRSDDAGDTWVPAGNNLSGECSAVKVDPATLDTAFITCDYTLYRTENGLDWAAVGPRPGVSLVALSASMLIAGQSDVSDEPGVLVSSDGGQTWDVSALYGEAVYDLVLQTGSEQAVLALSESGLYQSDDFGVSWIRIGANLPISKVLALAAAPDDPATVFAAAASCGEARCARSTDGGITWSEPRSIRGNEIWSMAVLATDPRVVLAGGMDFIYSSYDNGDTWFAAKIDDGASGIDVKMITPHPHDPFTAYAAADSHGLLRSTDAGVTWDVVVNDSFLRISTVVVGHENPDLLLYGTQSQGIARSLDGGESWVQVSDLQYYEIRAMAIDQTDDSVVLAATPTSVFRSVDSGESWADTGFSASSIFSLASSPVCEQCFIVGTIDGAYLSTDRGVTWRLKSLDAHRVVSAVDGTVYGASMYTGVTVVEKILFGDSFESGSTGGWTDTIQ